MLFLASTVMLLLPSDPLISFFFATTLALTYLHHLPKLLQIASDKIEEGEPIKVLGALVAHLHNLVISLQQCHFSQFLPAVLVIQSFGCFQSNLTKELTWLQGLCRKQFSLQASVNNARDGKQGITRITALNHSPSCGPVP